MQARLAFNGDANENMARRLDPADVHRLELAAVDGYHAFGEQPHLAAQFDELPANPAGRPADSNRGRIKEFSHRCAGRPARSKGCKSPAMKE